MTTPSTQTLLRAARLAYPELGWIITDRPSMYGKVIAQPEWYDSELDNWIIFDAVAHWPALQIALEKEGWIFEYFDDHFCAGGGLGQNHRAPTKPALLIAIVESLP